MMLALITNLPYLSFEQIPRCGRYDHVSESSDCCPLKIPPLERGIFRVCAAFDDRITSIPE